MIHFIDKIKRIIESNLIISYGLPVEVMTSPSFVETIVLISLEVPFLLVKLFDAPQEF